MKEEFDKATIVVESAISYVHLSDSYAFKRKKNRVFPGLDFSTLEKRNQAILREFELNKELNPEIYLTTYSHDGYEDLFLVMKKVEPIASNARLLKEFPKEDLQEVLKRLSVLWKKRLESKESVSNIIQSQFKETLQRLELSEEVIEEELKQIPISLKDRNKFYSDGHGDLNVENLFYHEGKLLPLDRLDFNDFYRYGDFLEDIAYLSLSLEAYGLLEHNNFFLEEAKKLEGFDLKAIELYKKLFALVRYDYWHSDYLRTKNEDSEDLAFKYLIKADFSDWQIKLISKQSAK